MEFRASCTSYCDFVGLLSLLLGRTELPERSTLRSTFTIGELSGEGVGARKPRVAADPTIVDFGCHCS